MPEKELLTGIFEADTAYLEKTLRISESFDLSKRFLRAKNGQKCALFYITGFANTQTVQDFMRYCLTAEDLRLGEETTPLSPGAIRLSATSVAVHPQLVVILVILTGLPLTLTKG